MQKIYSLLVTALLLIITNVGKASDFIPAKVIEDSNSKGISEALTRSRLEGWVALSYVVDIEGAVKDIIVLRSSDDKYVSRSQNYLDNLRFKPAKFSNEKVTSAKSFFLKHDKSFLGNRNDDISAGFKNKYNETYQYITSKNFKLAIDSLQDLEENYAKNLREQALSAWIHSVYYFFTKDWTEYGERIITANFLREYLPTSMAVKNTKNLLDWQIYKGMYIDAIDTLKSLKHVENTDFPEENYFGALESIVNSLDENEVIDVSIFMTHDYIWSHAPSRSTISLNVNLGEVDKVELRCDNAVHKFNDFVVDDFTIPPEYLRCKIFIKGGPSTEFTFTEKGKPTKYFID